MLIFTRILTLHGVQILSYNSCDHFIGNKIINLVSEKAMRSDLDQRSNPQSLGSIMDNVSQQLGWITEQRAGP